MHFVQYSQPRLQERIRTKVEEKEKKVKTLISFDTGMSTGIAVGEYSDTEPYRLIKAFQIEGGVEGFIRQVRFYRTPNKGEKGLVKYLSVGDFSSTEGPPLLHGNPGDVTFIAEKFTSRGTGNNFAYRTDALEPLRVEGAMLALGINPEWVSPQQLYFAGGESKSPVTNAHRWLKENGLHVTGKDVGCKDANDARSAILHSVAWLRRQKHSPTLKKYFKE